MTQTGASFANQGECVGHGAQGGVIYPAAGGPCLNGVWVDAFRRDGSEFATEAECVAYVAGGGQLAILRLTVQPAVLGVVTARLEGSGLTTTGFSGLTGVYTELSTRSFGTETLGSLDFTRDFPCTAMIGGEVMLLTIQGHSATAAEAPIPAGGRSHRLLEGS